MRTPNLRSERGIALVVAIVALVVIGAIVAGTFFVSSLEQKTAENSVDAAQAYQAAEAGLVKNVANWDTGNNTLAVDGGSTIAQDSVATGTYFVAAVLGVVYLFAARHARLVTAGGSAASARIMRRLPGPDVLDRLAYRTVMFAFPIWTFGIIAGAIWADQAWGRYWGWDPTETWAFITWVVYACFLHARATAGWRGKKAQIIQLAGFGCLIFNLVGVSLFVTGLHSYAGLN